MHFDRESTVVITKINNLAESVLANYCQKFGKIIRCFMRTASQSRNKESYALIKFAETSSVTSILSNRNHTINGTHVVMRVYHQEPSHSSSGQSLTNSMSSTQTNSHYSNGQKSPNVDQILQENHALKSEIANLQKSLTEAQIYSKTAYDTFQALREKFEAEQALTNQLRTEYADMAAAYEARLKQQHLPPSSTMKSIENDRIKEEPLDSDSQKNNVANYLLEIQVMKDRLEQAQIDLGKCQTENAILNAKLLSRKQQSDLRHRELNDRYIQMKSQYDHLSSCVQDFQSKLYQRKGCKNELKDDPSDPDPNSTDDIVELIIDDESMTS